MKISLIFVLILSLFLLSSCGLDYRYSLDKSLHNKIECVWDDENPSHIVYCGEKYVFVGTTNFFNVDTYRVADNYYLSYEDTPLSWNGYRYFGYIDEYYSDTSENPIFIYNERLGYVYFHENYDYLSDTFVVEGISSEIVWNDIFLDKQEYVDFEKSIEITLYSKQYSRIKTHLKLSCIENQWYASLPDSKEIWTISDEFVEILDENGII